MANFIFATCVRYKPQDAFAFMKSCRNVFSGEIVLGISELPDETLALLKKFGARTFEYPDINQWNFLLGCERFRLYRKIIKDEKLRVDRALLCDFRDIIFQSDPFAFDPADYRFKFFLEDKLIKECEVNSGWILHAYGEETFKAMAEQTISCSGTSMMSHDGLLFYLDKIVAEYEGFLARCTAKGLSFRTMPFSYGFDQGFHNYLIHKRAFPDVRLIANRTGEVQTMHYQTEFIFSKQSQLLNTDRRVCPILHQYDRHENFHPALMLGSRIATRVNFQYQIAPS
jgi:hypothetical protein